MTPEEEKVRLDKVYLVLFMEYYWKYYNTF